MVFGPGIPISREVHALLAEEFFEGGRVLVGGDTKNDTVARFDVLLEPVERGRFLDAGRAPTGPEIEDDNFAAQIRQMAGFPGYFEHKIFFALSGDGGLPLSVAGQSEDDHDSHRNGQGAPGEHFSKDSHRMLY